MVKRLYEPFATSGFLAPQLAARKKQTEHAGGNGTVSECVSPAVARQTCGGPVTRTSRGERLQRFSL